MLKIGIVGAGVMGNRHQGIIAAYGAQVVAVHDVHLPAAQGLATKTGAKIATDDLERFFEAEMDGWSSPLRPLCGLSRYGELVNAVST